MNAVRRLSMLGLVVAGLVLATSPARGAEPDSRWTWPLGGATQVRQGFAPPAQAWLAGHRGVDLLGRPGEWVRASGAGVVHFAGRIAGVGIVSVQHPEGLLTTYQPVRAVVRVGQALRAGQPLGRLMRAGSHCAPAACLHWGMRRGASYLDPLGLVGAAKVRLWPLRDSDEHPPGGPVAVAALAAASGLSRAGRRACRAAAAPPWCASDRSGSR
ncbi:MAG TPA: M23 family metallopeptidase [Mycobacteriales bacterium]|nr:M23 family metallopeptidase [Mycobacteriales bacterium]